MKGKTAFVERATVQYDGVPLAGQIGKERASGATGAQRGETPGLEGGRKARLSDKAAADKGGVTKGPTTSVIKRNPAEKTKSQNRNPRNNYARPPKLKDPKK